MLALLSLLTPLFSKLLQPLLNLAKLGTAYYEGRKSQQLDTAQEEIKDAKEAQVVKSTVSSLSDDDLNKLLQQ